MQAADFSGHQYTVTELGKQVSTALFESFIQSGHKLLDSELAKVLPERARMLDWILSSLCTTCRGGA